MKLTNSAVPVYTVAGSDIGRDLPEFQTQKQRSKKDPEYANRVELLQDFEFEEASQCVRVSEDGQWVMSTGTYKPQIHTHYLPNLALSWARHTDTLNKTFLIISSDYSKTVHLQEDRSIELHTPGGRHHALRIPRYGRDLAYDRSSTELLIPSVGTNSSGLGEVFRMNMELGRFMNPFEVDTGAEMTGVGLQGSAQAGSVNTAAIAEGSHGLFAFGTSLGTIEYWDPRTRARVAMLALPSEFEGRPGTTALDFHTSGIKIAAGASTGMIYLYDLRSPTPTLTKDQGYGFPILHLEHLDFSSTTRQSSTEPKVLSADKRIIKIWDEEDGSPWTSVEPTVDINSVAWCRDSGLFLTANESKQQHAFFIPQLGPAPKWCSFLDNVVEEMADDPNDPQAYNRKAGEIYDNYKFLTLPQLRNLNMDHLVGKTNLLRPYMHGYFVQQKLYEEARLIANPTSWEEERAKRVQQKIEKERESRIRGKKKVTAKVNRKMVERIIEREEKHERRRAQRVLAQGGDDKENDTLQPPDEPRPDANTQSRKDNLLEDPRFGRLFQDEDFAIDEMSREFHSLNPSTKVAPRSNLDLERGLTAVEEEMVDEVPPSTDDEANHSNSDTDVFANNRNEKIQSADYRRRPGKSQKKQKQKEKAKGMQMQVSSSTGGPVLDRQNEGEQSFASRAETMRPTAGKQRASRGVAGDKVVTFEPTSAKKGQPRVRGNDDAGRKEYRGAKDRRSASGNTFRRM